MTFLSVFWLLLFSQAPNQIPPIGIIDFYGLRTVAQADVEKALPFRQGESLPSADDELFREVSQTVARLKTIANVDDAQVEIVCCDHGKVILYVGIQERTAPGWRFMSAPDGSVRLPQEVVETGNKLDNAMTQSVQRGTTEEDDSNGYALAGDTTCRALQQQFITFAAKYQEQLRDALRSSSDAKQRALAAEVLGYSSDKQAIVPELIRAMQDPDPETRNNSMRALAVMAKYAQANQEAHITIPADSFVAMLNSVHWTDRNKSSFALLGLTMHRDPALLLSLRERALPSLIEMAQWKSAGHANAALIILGRIEGLPDSEIYAASENEQRAEVITAAKKLQKAGQ